MKILVKFLVLQLCLCFVCADDGSTTTTTIATPDDLEDLANIDAGRYTTLAFEYFNNQYLKNESESFNDTCIENYIRCLMSLSSNKPVCAFNNPWDRVHGYMTTMSFCEVYFDNCKRGLRVWQILDYGECRFWYYSSVDDIYHTYRKSNYPLINKLLNVLSNQPVNAKITASKYYPNILPKSRNNWRQIQQWYDLTRPGGVRPESLPESYELNRAKRNYQLHTDTQSDNIEVVTAKYSITKAPNSPWEEPSTDNRRSIEGKPILNMSRRNKNSFIEDLLGVLANQSGNTEISASKYNVSRPWLEPSYVKEVEFKSRRFF